MSSYAKGGMSAAYIRDGALRLPEKDGTAPGEMRLGSANAWLGLWHVMHDWPGGFERFLSVNTERPISARSGVA